MTTTLQELKEKAAALSTDERLELISAIETSLQSESQQVSWQFLEPYPGSWRKQLFMKGRKLRAYSVVSDMVVNKMTLEESADNWDLSVAAVQEAIDYCEMHRTLIKAEANQEREALDNNTGAFLEPTFAN